jgi:hypothetical protein
MPIFLPDAPVVTFDTIRTHFSQLVRRGVAEPAGFAAGILDYARREIPFDDIASTTEPRFHAWGAQGLALAALASPQAKKPVFPLSCPQPGYVRQLLTRMGGFGATVEDSVWLQIQRIISLQPSLQGNPLTRFFQTLFLLELVDSRAEVLAHTSPYDGLFQSAIGCTALDYLGLLFGFYAQSMNCCAIDLDSFFGQSPNSKKLRQSAERIFATEGCPQEDVGTLLDSTFTAHQAEGLVQAFSLRYPFVRLNDSCYLPPLHPFMRLLALSGPVFRTLDLARQAGNGSKPWTNQHSIRMGRRFEELVTLIVESARGPNHWEPEYEYEKGKKSPDFILFEQRDTAVLVQAKLKRMTPGAFFGYDLETFKTDSERFAETIWRSIRYLQSIRGGNRSGNPEADSVTNRVLSTKRVVLLGVAPFLSPVFVPGLPRDTIVEAVTSKISSGNQGPFGEIAGWHIICLEELAIFFSLAPRESLGQAIIDYTRDMGDTYITDSGMTPSFRNWCIERYQPTKARPLSAFTHALELLRTHTTESIFRTRPKT